jgi:hypothetical protein
LRPSAAQVWDFVLDRADGPSSLAASLSPAAELLEGHIDTTTTNRVRWGTRFTLVAALLHFPELEAELELLRSVRNVDLMEDQWKPSGPKRLVSNSLVSYILPSATHGSLNVSRVE